ncbi:proline and serine-rich protein 3 isoform X2 [Latimeria chalumnae]
MQGVEAGPGAAAAGKTQDVSALSERSGMRPAEDSVLAKYIERFRRGRPLSREERDLCPPADREGREFWWLQGSPPSSSTPTDKITTGSGRFERRARLSPGDSGQSPTLCRTGLQGSRSPLTPPGAALELLETGLYPREEPSDTSQVEPADSETVRLQEKANQLLQRSESSLSSVAPVSSDGVGSSPLSSVPSMVEPVRRLQVTSLIDLSTGDLNVQPFPSQAAGHPRLFKHVPPSSTRPQDDILFQWRLRRKMELARESPMPFVRSQKSLSPPVRLPRQGDEMESRAAEEMNSGSIRVTPYPLAENVRFPETPFPGSDPEVGPLTRQQRAGAVGNVPPHLHLMCDVLPCPHWDQHKPVTCSHSRPVARPARQTCTDWDRWEVLKEDGVDRRAQQLPSGGNTWQEVSAVQLGDREQSGAGTGEESLRGTPRGSTGDQSRGLDSGREGIRGPNGNDRRHSRQDPPAPGSSDPAQEPRRTGEMRRTEKSFKWEKIGAGGRLKPTPSGPGEERAESAVKGCRGTAEGEKASKPPGLGRPAKSQHRERRLKGQRREEVPPPSPVHSVLGQVVSERLFPPPPKPGSQRPKRFPASAEEASSPIPPSSSSASTPQPLEVLAQLLEEAEGSDGTEFDDDPLLQVLRQQRDWVRTQIREVDVQLELLDHSHPSS